MSIALTCPKCKTTAHLPDSAAGRKARCKTCGTILRVPSHKKLECCMCGAQLSPGEYTADEDGGCYCPQCAAERFGQAVKSPAAAAPSPTVSLPAKSSAAVSLPDAPPSSPPPAKTQTPATQATSQPSAKDDPTARKSRRRKAQRILISCALLVVAAGVAGLIIKGRMDYRAYQERLKPFLTEIKEVRQRVTTGVGYEEFRDILRLTKIEYDAYVAAMPPEDRARTSFNRLKLAFEEYGAAAQRWEKQVAAAAAGDTRLAQVQESAIQERWSAANRAVQEAEQLIARRE